MFSPFSLVYCTVKHACLFFCQHIHVITHSVQTLNHLAKSVSSPLYENAFLTKSCHRPWNGESGTRKINATVRNSPITQRCQGLPFDLLHHMGNKRFVCKQWAQLFCFHFEYYRYFPRISKGLIGQDSRCKFRNMFVYCLYIQVIHSKMLSR